MIIPIYWHTAHTGYIAGIGDGIVTVNGVPASRPMYLYETTRGFDTPKLVAKQVSLKNGHYLFTGLDPTKRYLVLCRPIYGIDERGVTAKAWDNVTPMNNKTPAELTELWQEMTDK